ncbi:hypothetical protein HZS_7254 [Henneguya salminicola]|nr:hypothetical protein HZS_7254 [Henneguya salminicola]
MNYWDNSKTSILLFKRKFKIRINCKNSGTILLISKGSDKIAGRPNNGPKRYIRRLGENFMNIHLNIAAFVSGIKKKFEYDCEKNSNHQK